MVDNTEKEWPRQVIDIELMEEELKKYNVNLRDEFTKVLAQNEHIAKAYKKRFQQQRFLTILGAVYADDTIYNDKEKEKHLLKLKKYYHQEKKKSKKGNYQYISLTTAEFYCNLLDAVQSQIEQDYPGIKLPTEEIGKPKAREEITIVRGTPRPKKTPKDIEDKKPYKYHILDLSKLDFVSADQMHQYCQEVLSSMVDGKTTTEKDQLIKLIADIEYAYGYSANVNDDMRIKTHTDKVRNSVSYNEGSSLTEKTQRLYINFIDQLEEKIHQEHPNQDIAKEEIRVLWPTEEGEVEDIVIDDDNHDDVIIHDDDDDNHNDDDDNHNDDDDNHDDVIPDDEEDVVIEEERNRVRSQTSDENAFMIDVLKLNTLKEMGVIDDSIYSEAMKDPAKAISILQQKIPLSEKQQAEFDSSLTSKMIDDERIFSLLPASVLVEKYEQLKTSIEAKQSKDKNADVAQEESFVERIHNRMIQLNNDFAQHQNLYYSDLTNISDTYEGYNKMLDILEATGDSGLKPSIEANRRVLNEMITSYDNSWNISGVESKDSQALEQRFDTTNKNLADIELAPETIEILRKFSFLDAQGNPEVQFAEDGKIVKGSKLDNIVRISKQFVAMESLKDDKDTQVLAQELNERVVDVIYGIHVNNQVEQGIIKEKPDQFTNKEYQKQFIDSLSNIETPLPITDTSYKNSVAGCINQVDGFVHRLAKKVGSDKPIIEKVYMPLSDLDSRANDRFTKNIDKKAYRKQMLLRTLKGGISAFAISGAITALGTAAAADASLTAATGGLNKFAGLAAGSALAIGLTIYQIRQWRKQQKANNQPRGIKAFLKDRRMMMTLGTTALGAAALGFAATGNPVVAQSLGIGAMALGTTNAVVSTMQDAKKQGVSKWEGFGWAVLQSAVNIGAGFGGRYAAEAGINWYNEQNPNNDIFRHEETKQTTVTETRTVVDVEQINADAKEFLSRTWYKNDPVALDALISKYGSAETVLYSIDAGAIETPALPEYNNVTDHTVLTESWANQNNVDPQMVEILRNPDAHTPAELQQATEAIRGQVDTSRNFVTRIENAPTRPDLYAGRNPESTYSHDATVPTKQETISNTITETRTVDNPIQPGIGMFGVFMNKIPGVKKLKERFGALADLIGITKKEKRVPKVIVNPVEDQVVVNPTDDKVVVNPTDDKVIVNPVEDKVVVVDPISVDDKPKQLPVIKELLDEYKIVYGADLYNFETHKFNSPATEARYKEYYGMVEAELKAETGVRKDVGITAYLMLRKHDLDKVICSSENKDTIEPVNQEQRDYLEGLRVKGNKARVQAEIVVETRQKWQTSNLSQENKTKLTLSHFTKYLPYVRAKSEIVADGSRNPDLNISFKNNPEGITVVSTDKLLFGKETEEVTKKIKFDGNETVLEKELAVRKALDDLNGVKHNPKTNEVERRVKNSKGRTKPLPPTRAQQRSG